MQPDKYAVEFPEPFTTSLECAREKGLIESESKPIWALIPEWKLEELKVAASRYEKLRRLDLRQMAELYTQNIRHGKNFDKLVDHLQG